VGVVWTQRGGRGWGCVEGVAARVCESWRDGTILVVGGLRSMEPHSPSEAGGGQVEEMRASVTRTPVAAAERSRTIRELMMDQPSSSPAAALRKEEHGQQQTAMADVEAAVRALRSFIVEVEQGTKAVSGGPRTADSIHLEQMPSSFRSLKRLGQRLDESFALLTQVRLRPCLLHSCTPLTLRYACAVCR